MGKFNINFIYPCSKKCDLAIAIEAAFDLKRMRTLEKTSYLLF